ncbi:hypothetical protein O3P69_020660 [Scylla paramamosain]|uniref:Ig-like domain-containing protein n=1 Tax=Scylla paramamosain TaxID=85552 RepID=A0AAW0TR60_SCYPA
MCRRAPASVRCSHGYQTPGEAKTSCENPRRVTLIPPRAGREAQPANNEAPIPDIQSAVGHCSSQLTKFPAVSRKRSWLRRSDSGGGRRNGWEERPGEGEVGRVGGRAAENGEPVLRSDVRYTFSPISKDMAAGELEKAVKDVIYRGDVPASPGDPRSCLTNVNKQKQLVPQAATGVKSCSALREAERRGEHEIAAAQGDSGGGVVRAGDSSQPRIAVISRVNLGLAIVGRELWPCLEGPLMNVTAVMEGEVLLPCDVATSIEGDLPIMMMFYRNESGTPIYTVDIRGRRPIQAKHKPVTILKDRAKFDMTPGNSGLRIRTVWSSDDGLYRCRVDFKDSPTRNSRIRLTVIVPPDSVRIVDINGNEKSSTIGPYVLGMTLTLKCIATGGRPPPKLTWWAGHKEVRGEVKVTSSEVINTLTIPSLQRHHLHQSFICHANNSDLAVPVTAAVTVDMTLPPMSIRLLGVDGPVSAGVGVTLVCMVVGARPEPTVTWWLDGRPLTARDERMLQNNVTESHLVLVATPEDQGRYLSCRAETPGLLQSSLEDGMKLVVHYVPKVTLSLDRHIKAEDVKEGLDVFFTCAADALPAPSAIHFYHNNNHISVNNTGGVLLFNTTLVLQKIDRYSSGSYSCRAVNTQGEGVSRPINLDVKYSPVCRTGQKWVYGIARNEMVHVSCQVDAHPKHVSFSWKFNNSAQTTDISEAHITSNLTLSTLTYTPKTKLDYGFLLCLATNSVGRQREPCVFKIFPAGPPDALKNCTVLNESTDAVQVSCEEGFDGGSLRASSWRCTRRRDTSSSLT